MKRLTLPGRRLSGMLTVIMVMTFFAGCQKDISEPGASLVTGDGSAAIISGDGTNYMVITKSETLPAGLESKLAAYGDIVNTIPEIGVVVVKPKVSGFETKVAKLTQVKAVVADRKVRWIDPNEGTSTVTSESIGSDESFWPYLWGMRAIHAAEAWDAGYTGQGARVFILDSGIDKDNPDLSPNLNSSLSTSFVPNENYFVRSGKFFSHGTHVAGTIAAADNQWGVIGVAPHAEIVAVKVLSEYTGSGAFSWINAGIVYAADNGADVINMSLGATLNRNGWYQDENDIWQKDAAGIQFIILAQQRAVNYAVKKGVIVIASAGNDEMNADGNAASFKLPGDCENVLAVSATAPECLVTNQAGSLDIPASYTNYGRSLVDLAAPGGDFDCDEVYGLDGIISTGAGPNPNGTWTFYFASGTSMAAPHVSGVAALIIGKNGGDMDPVAVTQQLLKTADKIDGTGVTPYFGYGRVNAYRAVTE